MTMDDRAPSRDEIDEIGASDELPALDPLPIIGQALCIFTCKDCGYQWTAVGGKRSDGTISIKMGQGIQPGERGDPTVCDHCGSRRNGLHVLETTELPIAIIRMSPVAIARRRESHVPTLWDALDATDDTDTTDDTDNT